MNKKAQITEIDNGYVVELDNSREIFFETIIEANEYVYKYFCNLQKVTWHVCVTSKN